MTKQTVSMAELAPMIREKIAAGGQVVLRVKGTSMRPFFVSDQTDVLLGPVNEPLSRFDVILYETANGAYALHRIIRIQDEFLTVCGDALMNNECDAKSRVIAKVFSISTNGKTTLVSVPLYRRRVRRWYFWKPLRPVLLAIRHHLKKG
jgi:hypothetical protein